MPSSSAAGAASATRVGPVPVQPSGGKSRAAQKRAKKQRKLNKPLSASEDPPVKKVASTGLDNANANARAAKDTVNKKSKPKKKPSEEVEYDEDDGPMDEIHSADEGDEDDNDKMEEEGDDDEQVEMKLPAPSSRRHPVDQDQDNDPAMDAAFAECTRVCDFLLLPPTTVTVGDETMPPSPLLKLEHATDEDDNDDAHDLTVRQRARGALCFILKPILAATEFYGTYWEQKPVHITIRSRDASKRHQFRHRFDGLLSLEGIRRIFETTKVSYGKDINVTRYETSMNDDGVAPQRRVTLDKVSNNNGSGSGTTFVVARPADVWRHWDSGCTIRLLCPHQHSKPIHALLSLLEWEFGCMVGANAYLTPANAAQGFAPHYDDIDAYCLQLQGQKRWKVYAPLQPHERLPRVSSADYAAADLRNVTPVMDIVLEPGDVLYMPRGWIHQACTLPESDTKSSSNTTDEDAVAPHSLHLTISAMQQWAWADLMEILLPEALEATIAADATTMRQGLPPRFLDYMGAIHDNREEHVPAVLQAKATTTAEEDTGDNGMEQQDLEANKLRLLQDEFRAQAKRRIMRVAKEAIDMLDAACDQMGKRFLSDRLPPVWTAQEASETNQGDSQQAASNTNTNTTSSNKKNPAPPIKARPPPAQVQPDTLCRMVRPGIARLVLEQSMAIVYHCLENSVVYHENPLSPMEFEMDDAPALEQLLTTIPPYWIAVEDLIHDSIDDKVGVAQALFDEGLLAIRSS